MQVAERAPRKGSRLAAKRKWRLKNELEGLKGQRKRRKRDVEAGIVAEEAEVQAQGALGAPNSRDNDEPESELHLMYNLVRSYISAIIKL